MCPISEDVTIFPGKWRKSVAKETEISGSWNQLSKSFSETIDALQNSIVAIGSGGRSTSSGAVWRPDVIVTVNHGIRRHGEIKVIHSGEPFSATLLGTDPATDLAVFRISSANLKPVETAGDQDVRTGEIVLSVGRSGLGDISASSGIIARTGSAWRTWRGGQIDRLIRPDVRLYVGQSGSVLINEQRRVLGINTPALARQAIITIPTRTIDRVVDAILERGHVPRPFVGIATQAVPVPESVRSQLAEETEQILLVMQVEPKTPADSAGVLVGDLIVAVNGNPVHSVRAFLQILVGLRVGENISLSVIRGGTKVDLTVAVGDRG
jgi:S1-C subfamily serine protease